MVTALAGGLLAGLVIAASPGPIFFLCIRRSLGSGFAGGAATGAGVALADATYAAVAAFGVSALAGFVFGADRWLTLLGGLVLVALGARTIGSRPLDTRVDTTAASLGGALVSGYLLTITNPPTILSFAALFAAIGTFLAAPAFVLGVLAGSLAWWAFLAFTVTSVRQRIDAVWTRRLTWGSGVFLIGFGVFAILAAIRGVFA